MATACSIFTYKEVVRFYRTIVTKLKLARKLARRIFLKEEFY
jgi:hypothetical protein